MWTVLDVRGYDVYMEDVISLTAVSMIGVTFRVTFKLAFGVTFAEH